MMNVMLMHLSTNMWSKKGHSYNNCKEDNDFIYRDKMITDRQTWVKVTDFCAENGMETILIDMGDGVIYDSHPELAIEGSWTKSEFRAELDRLRSKGLVPLPKFNFSSAHSAWLGDYGYMVGTEKYYQVCRDLIEEVIDLFDGPEYFHIGMEEEDADAQKNKPIITVRCPEIMARDINFLADVCKNKGARAWIWVNEQSVNQLGGDEQFKQTISKDIVLSPYYYGWIRPYYTEEKYSETVRLFRKLTEWGYDIVPCSSTWSWHLAMNDVMQYCKTYSDSEHILGYMMASWMLTVPEKYNALRDAVYNYKIAKRDVIGE